MKNFFYFLLISSLLITSCQSKKNDKEENQAFFPALSYIKSQVAHVDSSIYRIIKIVHKDSIADTTFLKREEFRKAAEDFLSIPDITSDQLKDEYVETRFYDEGVEQAILNYMPKNSDQEITRQEIMIQPGEEGDKVKSIFIDRIYNDKSSTIHKILFWQVDKRFRIVTITTAPNVPEKKETVEVVWNDFPEQ